MADDEDVAAKGKGADTAAAPPPGPVTLDLLELDDEAGTEELVGKVVYGSDGKLTLLAARPERKAALASVVREVNAKDTLSERVAPSAESRKFAIASRDVGRTDGQFIAVLQDHLRKYYRLVLR